MSTTTRFFPAVAGALSHPRTGLGARPLAARAGLHHRAQRVGDAPAPADHSAEVVIGHLDLEHDLAVDLLDLGHLDLVRILDQRPGEEVEQIAHETPPARRLAAGGL